MPRILLSDLERNVHLRFFLISETLRLDLFLFDCILIWRKLWWCIFFAVLERVAWMMQLEIHNMHSAYWILFFPGFIHVYTVHMSIYMGFGDICNFKYVKNIVFEMDSSIRTSEGLLLGSMYAACACAPPCQSIVGYKVAWEYVCIIFDLSIYLYTSIYQHLVESVSILWCFLVSSLPKNPRWICECGAPNLMSWSHCTKCSRPPRQDGWCVIAGLSLNSL